MQMSQMLPGDLVIVNVEGAKADKEAGHDSSFPAWLIDPAIYPVNEEGERRVRVEPVPTWATHYHVRVMDIIGHFPYKKGKRPTRIEKLLRDYDPKTDVLGGVVKVVKRPAPRRGR